MAKLKVVHKWVGLGRVKKTGPASNSGCTVPSPLIFQFNHWICVLLSIIMEQLDISE